MCIRDRMWEAVAAEVESGGGSVRMERDVVRIERTGRRIDAVVTAGPAGEEPVTGSDFISSMPVSELVLKLSPPAPPEVTEAARRLGYRDFLTAVSYTHLTLPTSDLV